VIRLAAISGVWLVLALAATPFAATPTVGPTWEHWRTIPGIFDVAGPRKDGTLVVAGNAQLFLVDPAGNVSPFAAGPQGYADDAGSEAYLTVSPGHTVSGAGCSFAPNEVFVLRLHAPLGITRIDAQGNASLFAKVTGVDSLNGIAFDTTGSFGYRLLASGTSNGRGVIVTIDCAGAVQAITRTGPALEGGLAVAPAAFGPFGGDLIVPDEFSGNIYAISPNGTASIAAKSGLPVGGDIGVESVAFVPQGFTRGGEAYYADRSTPNNAHPGTDSLLRMSAADLAAAAVHDGDMLAAAEGGATMIDVSCQATCHVMSVTEAASKSHGEGHIVLTVLPVSASPSSPIVRATASPTQPNREPPLVVAALVLVGAATLAGAAAFRRRHARMS
jgi:hypothetical protein